MPADPSHNDVYIVEFPKSGITWLSMLLANVALVASNRQEVATFASVPLYVPDIHMTRYIRPMVYDTPPVRFIKSHARYNPYYNFVILLVRHPVDVMSSYYRFLKGQGVDVGEFEDFIWSPSWGVARWKDHVNSWFSAPDMSQRLCVVRYENLVTDPKKELHQLFDIFGWNLPDIAIGRAMDLSSVEKMKGDEGRYRIRNPRYALEFVKGPSLQIPDDVRRFILSECREELDLLGYQKTA